MVGCGVGDETLRTQPVVAPTAITFCHDGTMAALLWLIIGIVLVLAEVLSGAFVLVMLGGAALVAALVALLAARH